ncbi:MAG: HD domain-containing protein [Candidatus Sericytochromatia bacterium]|nr:HD domain-containing protein [Candidatus Sericytochromatia bacterium]
MAPFNEAESHRLRSLAVTLLSHELRTPLTTISAAVEILAITLEDPALNADRRDFMLIISQGVKQLSSIIDELLLFSEVEQNATTETPVRRVDLPQQLRDVLSSLSTFIEAKRLHVTLQGLADVQLETVPGKLSEILLQLVSNAVKFTPAGRSFVVRASQIDDDIHVEVSDTGPGLSEEDCAELFTPFHQAENPMRRHQGGLGLGLYLAQRLARSLGGEILVASRLGEGATFTLVLPCLSPMAEQNLALQERLQQLEEEMLQAQHNLMVLSEQRTIQDEALVALKSQLWEQAQRLQRIPHQVATRTAQLERSYSDAVRGLSAALGLRSPHLHGHARRTAAYALTMGRELGLADPEIPQLGIAALLHDVGSIGLPDGIVEPHAPPEGVSAIHLQGHCRTGADLVAQVATLQDVAPIVRAHHERWDGTGYPDGLAGEAIPLGARFLAVADAMDNALCDFPYRPGHDLDTVIAAIAAAAGTRFDPTVVAVFLRLAERGVWAAAVAQYPAPGVLDDTDLIL